MKYELEYESQSRRSFFYLMRLGIVTFQKLQNRIIYILYDSEVFDIFDQTDRIDPKRNNARD
jgi:hypothetical protein